ncbi:DNA-binding NarL/FixJ family response regulator [Sphingomonas jinjuensis]|uniref:DNA-binding NarL/FixJ family response regulator n=1 Tax=Sphingomonas jinjuensis TaxID=535907 RepID=A0A840FFJ7_9SPHN|nr:response regulator transcription factor [Sphingomonas jinjuensis]MBB4155442.1 DNA-binding NarL/FixJ family response regulator [Sphingomonas jinjuensis]
MPLRALVADDHPMCREIATMALASVFPNPAVTEAATLSQALAAAGPFDLVILDLNLPDSRGLPTLIDIASARPDVPVLVISGSEGESWEAAVASAGAKGFVPKSAAISQIVEALRQVLAGGFAFNARCAQPDGSSSSTHASRLATLTPAEGRVLRAMSHGGLNKQIAYELGLSEMTIKQHVRAILRKLGVVNRTQAVLLYHDATQ